MLSIDTLTPEHEKPRFNSERIFQDGFSVSHILKEDRKLWLSMGRLRARTYVEDRSFLSADVLDENGAEYDMYDSQSDHFVALSDDGETLGTIRVIRRDHGGRLPCETLFDVTLPENVREISRFMVDSGIPPTLSRIVSMSLIRAALQDTSDSDAEVYAVIEKPLRRYLDDFIGIKLETIAEPQQIDEYNTVNLLVSMHPRSVVGQVQERDKSGRSLSGMPEKLATFFEQPSLGRVAMRAVSDDRNRQ